MKMFTRAGSDQAQEDRLFSTAPELPPAFSAVALRANHAAGIELEIIDAVRRRKMAARDGDTTVVSLCDRELSQLYADLVRAAGWPPE
jgi:hypothetical protein